MVTDTMNDYWTSSIGVDRVGNTLHANLKCCVDDQKKQEHRREVLPTTALNELPWSE